MVVHRRCRNKVGNYCGWKENSLEHYEKWREQVFDDHKIDDEIE